MTDLEVLKGNNATKKGKAYQNILTAFFNSEEGSVPWQEERSKLVH